jgi:hypothetical protein
MAAGYVAATMNRTGPLPAAPQNQHRSAAGSPNHGRNQCGPGSPQSSRRARTAPDRMSSVSQRWAPATSRHHADADGSCRSSTSPTTQPAQAGDTARSAHPNPPRLPSCQPRPAGPPRPRPPRPGHGLPPDHARDLEPTTTDPTRGSPPLEFAPTRPTPNLRARPRTQTKTRGKHETRCATTQTATRRPFFKPPDPPGGPPSSVCAPQAVVAGCGGSGRFWAGLGRFRRMPAIRVRRPGYAAWRGVAQLGNTWMVNRLRRLDWGTSWCRSATSWWRLARGLCRDRGSPQRPGSIR